MSNLEANKQIVRDFFQAWNDREYQVALDIFTEDMEWFIIGNTAVSGSKDKRGMRFGLKMLPRLFKGFRFVLHEFTAEQDRVAVTAESHGTHKSGRVYNNHYHFFIKIRDGKIALVREYLDTEHATWVETGRTGQE